MTRRLPYVRYFLCVPQGILVCYPGRVRVPSLRGFSLWLRLWSREVLKFSPFFWSGAFDLFRPHPLTFKLVPVWVVSRRWDVGIGPGVPDHRNPLPLLPVSGTCLYSFTGPESDRGLVGSEWKVRRRDVPFRCKGSWGQGHTETQSQLVT